MADDRAPRADAARNRARILTIARVAFAVEGPDVPLDEIARRAGVGAGTVHRHFPTKRDLLAAVVVDRLEGLAARAEELRDAADPVEAFFLFLRELTAEARENIVLTTAIGESLGETAEAAAELSRGLGLLLDRAQRTGGVKGEVSVVDIHAILNGVIVMERGLPYGARGLGLDVVIDGLRSR